MRTSLALIAALVLLTPPAGHAQDTRASLEAVARAMGADDVKSLEYTGSGVNFAPGQSQTPGQRWPRFNLKTFKRAINYETAALRDDLVRTQAEDPPRGGGVQPVRGEQRQVFVLGGEHAWNVAGEAAIPAPIALAERQMQLWTTPHGVVKAAIANNATIDGRIVAFRLPNGVPVKAIVGGSGLVEKVQATIPSTVVGDMPVEVTYMEYRDVGRGVKFPMKIRQSVGGFPTLDLDVTDVRANVAVDVPVPDGVRQAKTPYSVVTTQMVADGVWFVSGGSHNSVAIEMRDHLIVVEAPLNDERALAVITEVRSLAPGKPVRYVVASHHHFDHAGGLRAFVAEGVAVMAHESTRAYLERVLATPATVQPDHLAKSNRKPTVEGVRDRRVLTDGTRVVELHRIAGSLHADSMLMVYLPKERLLVQADAFTPPPPNAAPVMPPSPFSVNLADNIVRLGLDVDRLLPLHGRMVPIADLNRAIGRAP
jgi:glyoxylase-like metal-dependent hydrolase (beta-lactamase superfamily II)